MIRYAALLGKRVEVVYRFGTVYVLAVGVLLGDSGEFIFVEQQYARGSVHLKIPYHCIARMNESNSGPTPAVT